MVIHHYFSGTDSLYDEDVFERGFGSPRGAIDCGIEEIIEHDPFILKHNIAGEKLGIRPLVLTVASV